jgi:hypothetical protein
MPVQSVTRIAALNQSTRLPMATDLIAYHVIGTQQIGVGGHICNSPTHRLPRAVIFATTRCDQHHPIRRLAIVQIATPSHHGGWEADAQAVPQKNLRPFNPS